MKNLKVNNNNLVAILKVTGMKAKLMILCCAFFFISQQSQAQFILEPFVGNDDFILESWYYNSINESKSLSIFSLNEARHNFETESNSFLSYGVLGYDWKKGFGPIIGWRISPYSAAALAGFQYGIYRENFFIILNLNSELKKDPNLEMYSIIQYRKPITEKFKAFSQLQISKNFTVDNHSFSLYRFRLGADLGKIQTGIGLEQTMSGKNWSYDIQPGFFVRLELY